MGVCNCSMFCCMSLYVHSSIAIILMGKRELIALLNLSSWCLVMVERLFLAVPRGCLQFVIVVFPDHTHLLFPRTLSACPSVTDDFVKFVLKSPQTTKKPAKLPSSIKTIKSNNCVLVHIRIKGERGAVKLV